MKVCCTFISKERRMEPARYRMYRENANAENSMTLWKNDVGNAAAVLIAERGIKKRLLRLTGL